MAHTISIGQLRQNPTRMLRDVRSGARYTITDHGEPVASVTSIRTARWVPSEDVDALLRELGADAEWAREVDEARADENVSDPWAGDR